MAENRDDILNELIQYYDSNKSVDDPDSTENTNSENEEMGATRIIEKKPSPPVDDLGDTVVVGKVETASSVPSSDETENTVRIDTSAVPTPKPPVSEEILGSMSLDGTSSFSERMPQKSESNKKADADYHAYEERIARRRLSFDDSEDYNTTDNSDAGNYGDEEYYEKNSRGIWYSLKPLWVTLILTALAFAGVWFYITDNSYVSAYKRNFEYNMNLILDSIGVEFDPYSIIPTKGDDLSSAGFGNNMDVINSAGQQYDEGADGAVDPDKLKNIASNHRSIDKETVMLPFVDAGSSDFSVYDNGIVCAKSNYLCRYNSNGKLIWELQTNVANPLVSSAGKYIAVASEGGTAVNLYKDNKLEFKIEIQNTIVACEVSERGDVTLITNREAYKGAVLVINKYGEEIFSWASGVNYITAAALSEKRVLSVALVDTASSVNSYVMMFDVSAPEPFAGIELQNTLVFDLFSNGSLIYASGDNSITAMNENCSLKYDKRYDNVYIAHLAEDSDGNRIVAFTDDNLPIINIYSSNGSLLSSSTIENKPDIVDIYKSTILYCYDRDIVCGKAASEHKSVYTAPMAIKKLLLLNSDSYVIIYENGIEFVKI